MTFFCKSIVGEDHSATPDGPQVLVPALFWPTGFATSRTVYACQIFAPVLASSATMLPRNVQHSYFGFVAAIDSSLPETGTYRRPDSSFGLPVITASGCSSARVFHTNAPVSAFNA